MTPWVEDRLLARTAQFGEWWTLERLHEAFGGLSSSEDSGRTSPHTAQGGPRPDLDGPPSAS